MVVPYRVCDPFIPHADTHRRLYSQDVANLSGGERAWHLNHSADWAAGGRDSSMSAPLIQSEIAIDIAGFEKHFADKMAVNGY